MPEQNNTPNTLSRRQFGRVAGTAAAALGFNILPSHARGALTQPTLVGIGMGGKGKSDIFNSEKVGFRIVGLVDVVDVDRLRRSEASYSGADDLFEVRSAYPDVPFFLDYREMLDAMGDKVDAVTVSTPDHHHFHACVLAMQAGKHIYCQKPLTHGIWEARMMQRVAAQTGVKTQMGNQAHAEDHMRRCVELVRSGIIGPVREVHTWTNRPIWPQGFSAPPPGENVPRWMDWEQWVGPAGHFEYSPKIAPFAWRGWWEYGTGALGDMACHIMDMPFWALRPGPAKFVVAEQQGATDLSPPISSKITWEFEPNEYTHSRGVRFHWYDGYVDAHFDRETWSLVKESEEYNHPRKEILDNRPFDPYGCVVIGDRGKLFFHRHNENWVVNPSRGLDGFSWPAPSIPRAENEDPHMEWMNAVRGDIIAAQSNFDYAAPFTEMILLGVLAQRYPNERLEWDAENMRVVGHPELDRYIRRDYRSGWNITV